MMIAAALLSSVLSAAPAIDCDARYTELAETTLDLDYQRFDQTQGSGFRILAEANCPRQAADLIERYRERNRSEENSLLWHIAQLRGEAGQTDAAIIAATASLKADEPADQPFRWNAHVRAYLAFLQNDRAAFDAAVAELHANVEAHQGNAINAGLWEKLAPHFDQGYRKATRLSMQQAKL